MVSCYYFSIFFWLCKHDLASSGVNHNINDVVMVVRRPGGIDTMPANNRLLWLENGDDRVGLNHILGREYRVQEFANRGIERDGILNFLHRTLQGEPFRTGSRPSPVNGRIEPFADFFVDGRVYRLAHGDNGFIISFYPQ